MLEQFKIAYDIHLWVRRTSWGGLILAGILLFWVEGGFPPQSWHLLGQEMPQLAHLWLLRGPAILLPLAALTALSFTWLIVWVLLVGACIAVLRHQQHNGREQQQFTTKLHQPVTPKQSAQSWMPSRARLQVLSVIPGQTEREGTSAPLLWQRQLSLNLDIGTAWDVGLKRRTEPNEDSLVAFQGNCIYNIHLRPFGLFVIADGIGSHENGQDASYLAIKTFVESVLPHIVGTDGMNDTSLLALLVEGVQQANVAVYQRRRKVKADMGTTITVALVMDTAAFVVGAGDSRTYLYRECEGLSQVTPKHSEAVHPVAVGPIADDNNDTHSQRNRVNAALGATATVEVDWFHFPIQVDDRLLLCSRGLWEMVPRPEIERIIQQPVSDATQTSQALLRAAFKGGGEDNVSVIVVHIRPR